MRRRFRLSPRHEVGRWDKKLNGQKIAILVADGFEQVEMTEPRKALEAAGAKTDLVSPDGSEVRGMNHHEKGDKFPADRDLKKVSARDYDALLLPGGVMRPVQATGLCRAHSVSFEEDSGKDLAVRVRFEALDRFFALQLTETTLPQLPRTSPFPRIIARYCTPDLVSADEPANSAAPRS